MNLGEWDHLAITYDDASEMKKLYVNGELAVEANDSVFPNDTTPLNIGAGADFGGTFFFKGDLDDIGIWSRALSLEDIQVVMEQGVTGLGGGVVGPEVAYEAPEGGWAYSVDVGDISAWSHDNGSDQWDGSPIGGEFGDDNRPGGVSLLDGYVRLQDTGDPRDYGYSDSGQQPQDLPGPETSATREARTRSWMTGRRSTSSRGFRPMDRWIHCMLTVVEEKKTTRQEEMATRTTTGARATSGSSREREETSPSR